MGKKTGIGRLLIGAVALAAAALPAMAQERPIVTEKDSGAVRVTASGRIYLDYVYRAREITAFTSSVSNPAGVGNAIGSNSENTFEGETAVRLDVELGDKVYAVLEFGTKKADVDPTPGGTGGMTRWGEGGVAPGFLLREARIVLADLILPKFKVEAGLTTWMFDVRGKGSSFAFDPRHAQTMERHLGSDGSLNVSDDAVARLTEAAFLEDLEATGVVLSYSPDFATIEVVLLPGVVEGGSFKDDQSTYAVDVWIPINALGEGSRVGIIASVTELPTFTFDSVAGGPILAGGANEHSQIFTIGGGTSLMVMKGLEVFGEAYFNRGKAGQLDNGTKVKATGKAFQAGFEWHYTVGNPLPFWFNATYFYLSGEDSTSDANNTNGKFASYENINDLMILEDRYYGFDWDTNYKGFKFSGGATFSAAKENDLDVKFIVGLTRCAEKVSPTAASTTLVSKLGNEVDVRITWNLNKQFLLRFSGGYLFGSDVLESAINATAPNRAEDKTWIYVLGFDLTF